DPVAGLEVRHSRPPAPPRVALGSLESEVEVVNAVRPRGPGVASQVGGALVQTVVVLVVLAVAGYELIAIGVTSFAVDDASRQVARAARDAYRSSDGSLDATVEAATAAA